MERELEKVNSLEVKPLIDNQPVRNGELIGDALSVISLRDLDDDSDPDRVVRRNSFRDLHHPNLSYLDWVAHSSSKEEVVQEKVRSFHSSRSLSSRGASGHDMVVDSRQGPTAEKAVREKSRDASTQSSEMLSSKGDDAKAEYLIQLQTLGKLGNDIAAFREKADELGATSVDAEETTESMLDQRSTVSQPAKAKQNRPNLENGETTAFKDRVRQDKASTSEVDNPEATSASGNDVEMEDGGPREGAMLQELHGSEKQQQTQQLEEQRKQKETAKKGRSSTPASDVTAKKAKVVTIPDIRKRIPLSESSVRAADVVTIDILDRAINEDCRRFSTSSSWSLCQMAQIIVTRVVDSARNRVIREDRLPPAKTWTEKARREAFLLVEDVISSAMIYIGRGGDADATRPTPSWTPASMKATSLIVDEVMDDAEPHLEQYTPEQLPQLLPQALWAEQDDQQDNKKHTKKSQRAMEAEDSRKERRQSLMDKIFIIGQLPPPPPLTQQQQQQPQPSRKDDGDRTPSASRRRSLLDQIYIIEPPPSQQRPQPGTEDDEKDQAPKERRARSSSLGADIAIITPPPSSPPPPQQTLESGEQDVHEDEHEAASKEYTSDKRQSDVFIAEHAPIARELWSHYESTNHAEKLHSSPHTSTEKLASHHAGSEQTISERPAFLWQQLQHTSASHRRRSTGTTNVGHILDVVQDDDKDGYSGPTTANTGQTPVRDTSERPTWQQLFLHRRDSSKSPDPPENSQH